MKIRFALEVEVTREEGMNKSTADVLDALVPAIEQRLTYHDVEVPGPADRPATYVISSASVESGEEVS